MDRSDEDDVFGLKPKPKPTVHTIGESLDAISIDELAARINLLLAEIRRLEAAQSAKSAAGAAADAFFRKPATGS